MEARKLKRYESAPLPLAASSSPPPSSWVATAGRSITWTKSSVTAAATKTVTAVTRGLPIHRARGVNNPTGTTASTAASLSSSPHTPPKTPIPISASPTAASTYERELEQYYQCLEEDNESLLKFYKAHLSEIAALRSLTHESKFADTVVESMQAEMAAMHAFLKELMDLTTHGRGLRTRGDVKVALSTNGTKTAGAAAAQVVSRDAVRDAVQKLLLSQTALHKNEEKHKQMIRALEEKVSALKAQGAHAQTRQRAFAPSEDDTTERNEDICLPGSAKALREAQRRSRELERQLNAAAKEATNTVAKLGELQEQHAMMLHTLKARDEELKSMRCLLASTETAGARSPQMWKECEKNREATPLRRPPSATAEPNPSEGSSFCNAATLLTHRGGGGGGDNTWALSHHRCILNGKPVVEGYTHAAEQFKETVTGSIATVLRVSRDHLTNVEIRTQLHLFTEGVVVEFDVRHLAETTEEEIEFLLLNHDFSELAVFLSAVKVERAEQEPLDCVALRMTELQRDLAEREREIAHLRRTMRSLEDSLDRRDGEREMLHADVDAALHETETTVTELYEALQAAQKEVESSQKALALKATQLHVQEHAREAASRTAAQSQEEAAQLREQLAAAHATTVQVREEMAVTMRQRQLEEMPELLLSFFSIDVALPTTLLTNTARRLLNEAAQMRLLQALLLGHAGRAADAVPVQAKALVLNMGAASQGSTLQATVELAFYATKQRAEAVKAEVSSKLKASPCSLLLEYLRMCSDVARRENAIAEDAKRTVREAEQRATAVVSAMREETNATQRTTHSITAKATEQLREIRRRVSSALPDCGGGEERLLEDVELLVSRLTSAEAEARRGEEDGRRLKRSLTEAQLEREQLQQTLSELTGRCTEMRMAKEQMSARLTTAEHELRMVQSTAKDREKMLTEELGRLEAALGAKAALAAAAPPLGKVEHRPATTPVRSGDAKEFPAASPLHSSSTETEALQKALRHAQQERDALTLQVKEMDADMNDLSNIQAATQRELEVAQQEVRARKHDCDLLVKQLIGMEEREKKWNSEHPGTPAVPETKPAAASEEELTRASLAALTKGNATLQQCIFQLCEVMPRGGIESEVRANGGDNAAAAARGDDSIGAALSCAAVEHQRLTAQLAKTLSVCVKEMKKVTSFSIVGNTSKQPRSGEASELASPPLRRSKDTATPRILKLPPSPSPLLRTASSPAVMGGRAAGEDTRDAPINATVSASPQGVASKPGASGGRVVLVDAAPRLDFSRQASSRTYMRSATANAAVGAAGTEEDTERPRTPPPAAGTTAAAGTSSKGHLSTAAPISQRSSGTEKKEEEEGREGNSGWGKEQPVGASSSEVVRATRAPTNATLGARRTSAAAPAARATVVHRGHASALVGSGVSGGVVGAGPPRTASAYRRLPASVTYRK